MAAHDAFFSASWWTFVLVSCVLANSTTVQAEESILELATTCAACHGENGVPQEKTTPVIWGQNEGYMYLQLRDMQKGTRKNEQMRAIVEGLERADLRALAAHFSKLNWPNLGQAEAPPAVEKKAKTASFWGCCISKVTLTQHVR